MHVCMYIGIGILLDYLMFLITSLNCSALSYVQISDQLKSRFSSGLSLPQICENIIKAAYDPRISGIYLHIETLNCGWGKVEEIRRHILDFKESGSITMPFIFIFIFIFFSFSRYVQSTGYLHY
jgi:hypothetical protein